MSTWGSCLPGQLSYLGSCPTWAVVLPGQLSYLGSCLPGQLSPGQLSAWAVVGASFLTWMVLCKSCSNTWKTCPAFWEGKNELKYIFLGGTYKIYIWNLNFPAWSQTKTSNFFLQKSCPGALACSLKKNIGTYPRFLDIVPRSVKCTYCYMFCR